MPVTLCWTLWDKTSCSFFHVLSSSHSFVCKLFLIFVKSQSVLSWPKKFFFLLDPGIFLLKYIDNFCRSLLFLFKSTQFMLFYFGWQGCLLLLYCSCVTLFAMSYLTWLTVAIQQLVTLRLFVVSRVLLRMINAVFGSSHLLKFTHLVFKFGSGHYTCQYSKAVALHAKAAMREEQRQVISHTSIWHK